MRRASLRASNNCRLTGWRLNRWKERNPKHPVARKTCVGDWSSRFHRSVEDKMKKAVMLPVLLLGMLLPLCSAQEKPKPDEKPKAEAQTTPVKVQIVFTEFEGDKKVKSLPYTLYINAPDAPEWHSSSFVKLRVGS